MERIDLHVHSNASDGSLTPTEVADEAMRMGLSAIALTDHDTVDGVAEILDYTKDKPLEVVPGIELSCYITIVRFIFSASIWTMKTQSFKKSLPY